MAERDTKGDIYEYMLSKIATAGQNGQFRTPRHIIRLMVELTTPQPTDTICDPASGTCGFLVAAGEYLRDHHAELFRDPFLNNHFHHAMFHGFDFDNTMLRIGSMNMMLHGVDYLTERGTMDAARLYESPFTDLAAEGPDAIFTSKQVDDLLTVLDQIKASAIAA